MARDAELVEIWLEAAMYKGLEEREENWSTEVTQEDTPREKAAN